MRVAYYGNFSVPFSTESHVAASLESLNHEVLRLQEGQVTPLSAAEKAHLFSADMFLWTQTYSLAHTCGTGEDRFYMLGLLEKHSIPSVGFHLDRWWGLERQTQIREEPFFRVNYLFTADGGHDDHWKDEGINHYWLPPAVYHAECFDTPPHPQFRSDLIFVGSWRNYGHEEWWHVRAKMLSVLRSRFGSRFKTYPVKKAIRGKELTQLYNSCKLAIGDSCLAGNPSRYWSDRVPETLGRGALLVHPYVEGIEEVHPHLPTFPSGDWDRMVDIVRHYLANPNELAATRAAAVEHTRLNHTYRNRMKSVLEIVNGG